MRRTSIAIMTGLIIILTTVSANATVFYVKPNGSDNNNGLSWDQAKRTLTMNSWTIAAGDEVWVATGSYSIPTGWKAGVSLFGGFSGTETSRDDRNWKTNKTTINGSVLLVPAGTAPSARVDGFIISAMVYCSNASPTIANNRITSTTRGGIDCSNASPVITNNVVSRNSNIGIICRNGSKPLILNNTIGYNNLATTVLQSTPSSGGGIYCENSSPTVINNTIVGNVARASTTFPTGDITLGEGGAIYCKGSSLVLINNILAYNSCGVFADSGSQLSLKCNCFYKNGRYEVSGVPDPVGVDSNISADPQFVSAVYSDLHIQPGSPCIDAGDNNSITESWVDIDQQSRAQGDHVDIGADESDGTSWPAVLPRIVYVRPDGSNSSTGDSWGTARQTISSAISLLPEGGEIWCAAGTYYENVSVPNGVFIYGGFAGNEMSRDLRMPRENETIIDGSSKNTVVTFLPGCYMMSGIDGTRIKNGAASIKQLPASDILCVNSSPLIINNVLEDKARTSSVFTYSIYSLGSIPSISGNIFPSRGSSAIRADSSMLHVTRNTFRDCERPISSVGPAILEDNIFAFCDEGINITDGSVTANRNTMIGTQYGIACGRCPSVDISNNWIVGTIVCALYVGDSPSITITNNKITGHSAGVIMDNSGGLIAGNTIAYCKASGTAYYNEAGIDCTRSSPEINNNIVAFCRFGIQKDSMSAPILKNNCVYGSIEGDFKGFPTNPTGSNGNISADPLFVNPEYADIHIRPESPCRDAGFAGAAPAGWLDIDCHPRTEGASVDIGADEFNELQPVSPQVIRVAMDGNDSNDGSSWQHAKKRLDNALVFAAIQGREVWVKSGTYDGNTTVTSFVQLFGGFNGTEDSRDQRNWSVNRTVLNNKNGYGLSVKSWFWPSRIDGFIIKNGDFGIFSMPSRVCIANNKVVNNNDGIYLSGLHYGHDAYPETIIYNNTICRNSTHGFLTSRSSVSFINNTLVANSRAVRIYANDPIVNANNIVVYNNLGVEWPYRPTSGSNNCVYANSGGNYISNTLPGAGDICADPLFVDRTGENYHLRWNSPCLNTGLNDIQDLPALDYEGQGRIWWETADIGADEYWPVPIIIDVKPGEFPNCINTENKGLVTVAILTTPTFDVTQVDPASITFAGDSPAARGGKAMVELFDVDGDGDLDLVARFNVENLTLSPGQTHAVLVAKIRGGDYVQGSDSVVVK